MGKPDVKLDRSSGVYCDGWTTEGKKGDFIKFVFGKDWKKDDKWVKNSMGCASWDLEGLEAQVKKAIALCKEKGIATSK